MSSNRCVLAVVLALLSLDLSARPVICPKTILETTVTSGVSKPVMRRLESTDIYFEKDGERGALVPDSDIGQGGRGSATWRLIQEEGGRYLVGCSYAGTTEMRFIPVPAKSVACSAHYAHANKSHGEQIPPMDCQ